MDYEIYETENDCSWNDKTRDEEREIQSAYESAYWESVKEIESLKKEEGEE